MDTQKLIEEIEDTHAKLTEINNLVDILVQYFENNLDINDKYSYHDYVVDHPKYRSLLDVISQELKIIETKQYKLVSDYYKYI